MLALVAVGHALVTSVRRHRRELAVLKTLGFDRHQIRATVAWQATTIATAGLIVGIPAGVIIGSLVWRQVANGLGISTTPAVPALALILVIPCALAAVNVIAFFPAAPPPAHDPPSPSKQSDRPVGILSTVGLSRGGAGCTWRLLIAIRSSAL